MQTVVFDFDGVIHSYTSGWKGYDKIPDPPVKGIKEAIDEIRSEGYEVVVCSTRCGNILGMLAVKKYLMDHNIIVDNVVKEKPPAIVYIDDRAICFNGESNKLLDKIKRFEPWYKKSSHSFQLAYLFGNEVIFTIDRIKDEEISELGLYKYEVMHDDKGNPAVLQENVLADFYGTILSDKDLLAGGFRKFGKTKYKNLNKYYLVITNDFVAIEEYINKKGEYVE